MSRPIRALLAFLAGLVLGWGLVVGAYIVATGWLGYFDRDGGGAMGAIFVLGPMLGVLLGIALALFAALRGRRGA